MSIINPDDERFDFIGDLAYDPKLQSEQPSVHQLTDFDGMMVRTVNLQPPATYEHLLGTMDNDFGLTYYEEILNDEGLLRLYGIAAAIRLSLHDYKSIVGEYPADLGELMGSGIGPIDHSSINPKTGDAFFGDGREFGLYYERLDVDSFKLFVTRENGEIPQAYHFY